jgi:hypothetical protein
MREPGCALDGPWDAVAALFYSWLALRLASCVAPFEVALWHVIAGGAAVYGLTVWLAQTRPGGAQ